MEIHVSIGENQRFELREALLVYGDRQRSFVTRHQVVLHKNASPTLEPAQPLTVAFIESLVHSLYGGSTAEVLPEHKRKLFPVDTLIQLPQTLAQFVRGERG
jgi:hypothetical protein